MATSTESDWDLWLDTIERDGVNLTVFEEGFIESMLLKRANRWRLSEKEAAILERIYAERTP